MRLLNLYLLILVVDNSQNDAGIAECGIDFACF